MSGVMKEGKMDISEVKIINVSAELKKKAKRNVSRRKALTACVILLIVAIAFVVFFQCCSECAAESRCGDREYGLRVQNRTCEY